MGYTSKYDYAEAFACNLVKRNDVQWKVVIGPSQHLVPTALRSITADTRKHVETTSRIITMLLLSPFVQFSGRRLLCE